MLPFVGTKSPLKNLPRYRGAFLSSPFSVAYLGDYRRGREGSGSHPGVDIVVLHQTVFAIASGEVIVAKKTVTGFGYRVVIRHDGVPEYGTVFSAYCHLDSFSVRVGQIVRCGEQIGVSGNTGNSTGAHLHFQLDRAGDFSHPFWPFSLAECRAAGYRDFAAAVSAGFAAKKVRTSTLDPLAFVEEFRNFHLPVFVDTRRSPHYFAIKKLQQLGYLDTPADCRFHPKKTATLAEAVKLLALVAGFPLLPSAKKSPAWFEIYFAALQREGVDFDQKNPERELTFEDFSDLLGQIFLQRNWQKIFAKKIGKVSREELAAIFAEIF